jgi:sugar phosphate isomerase/epimerase
MEKINRRNFIKNSVVIGSGMILVPTIISSFVSGVVSRKPNSKFGGVQIGAVTYSWRSMPGSAEDILKYCLEAGINSIEMMGGTIEDYVGAPQDAEERKTWRRNVSMKKFAALRKKYKKAGVEIHLVNFGPAGWRKNDWWSDEETDYAFNVAKAMGAEGVTNEIGNDACQRLGKFAEKHGMLAVFHNHGQPGEAGFNYDKYLSYSPANMLCLDAGHYFGATGKHPNELISRLHDRIYTLHLKDKTGPNSNPKNSNTEWGKGETPIADMLKLIQKNKWPIFCDIELEYEISGGSDAQKEIIKCVQYCKNILI